MSDTRDISWGINLEDPDFSFIESLGIKIAQRATMIGGKSSQVQSFLDANGFKTISMSITILTGSGYTICGSWAGSTRGSGFDDRIGDILRDGASVIPGAGKWQGRIIAMLISAFLIPVIGPTDFALR